jgi:hypothetical protein
MKREAYLRVWEKSDKDFEGKIVSCYKIERYTIDKRDVFTELVKEFEILLSAIKTIPSTDLSPAEYNKAYEIFFFGYLPKVDTSVSLADSFAIEENTIESKIFEMRDYQLRIANNEINWNLHGLEQDLDRLKILVARGHSDFLSHYFRHLYHTVKFIVSQEISYDEKIKYLRVLRAQLSNQEQALIFYNWFAQGYGSKWEDVTNQYFTEYCMIHNLWHDRLFDDKIVKNALNYLIEKKPKLRKGPLFEIGTKNLLHDN